MLLLNELRGIFRDLVRHGFFRARSSGSSRIDMHTRYGRAIEYFEIYGRLTALVLGWKFHIEIEDGCSNWPERNQYP